MPPIIEPFNFTESFRKTVARYDTLSAASRADYERTRAKQILKEIENMDLADEKD